MYIHHIFHDPYFTSLHYFLIVALRITIYSLTFHRLLRVNIESIDVKCKYLARYMSPFTHPCILLAKVVKCIITTYLIITMIQCYIFQCSFTSRYEFPCFYFSLTWRTSLVFLVVHAHCQHTLCFLYLKMYFIYHFS